MTILTNLTLISHQLVHLKGGFEVRRPNTKTGVFTVDSGTDESVETPQKIQEARKRIVNRIKRNYQVKVTYPKDATPEKVQELNGIRMAHCRELIAQLDEDIGKFKATGERVERTIYKKKKPHFTYIFEPHHVEVMPDVPMICFDKLPPGAKVHFGHTGEFFLVRALTGQARGETLLDESKKEFLEFIVNRNNIDKKYDAEHPLPYPVGGVGDGDDGKNRMMYSRKALGLPDDQPLTRELLEEALAKKNILPKKPEGGEPPTGKGRKAKQTPKSRKNKQQQQQRKPADDGNKKQKGRR